MNLETTPTPETKQETPNGCTEITGGYLVPTSDSHIGKWQVESGRLDHDRHLHDFIASKIKTGDVCLDIGAFNGDSALPMSNACGETGMVIAVEAGPVAELLKYNVSLFPIKNVFALHGVVGEFCGESTAHTMDFNMGASRASIIPRENLVAGEKYVMTVTGDYLANMTHRKIAFIKLDIEGWEVHALVGSAKTLKNDQPLLLIEVNGAALEAQGSTIDELYELLMQFGYKWEIMQAEVTDIHAPQYDIFCYPSPEGIALFK